MSDKSLTLLELHLDDSRIQFGPRTLGSGSAGTSDTKGDADSDVDVIEGPETADGTGSTDGAGALGGTARAVVALLAVVGLALAAWKLLGGGDLEAVEDLDELAE